MIDLTKLKYHGGTTYSSGVLPKWDVLDETYMIKRCIIDGFENHLTDSANEELVYSFCNAIGIKCAYYKLVRIKYNDEELKKVIECPAVVTKIFKGDLNYYKDIRELYKLGSINDELIDFSNNFNIYPELNDYFFIDYIFNQQDRHSKNFGVIEVNLAPLYDSGACLFYDTLDNLLIDDLVDNVIKHKSFGKRADDLLDFSIECIDNKISFNSDVTFLINTFKECLVKLKYAYSEKRYKFIEKFVERRINSIGQILSKAERGV